MTNLLKMLMASGVANGPQVIAPSSNDWDYTFAQDEWPFAGNALGDNTSGGFVANTAGESGISSLTTFDGDFEIQFTATDLGAILIGVAEIAEDSKRVAANHYGMYLATTESWSYSEIDQGLGTGAYAFLYGDAKQTNSQIVDGSVVKITRVAGVISFFDDDVLKHEFTQTSINPVRFFMATTATVVDLDDLLFTDTAKIQRDGFYDEGLTGTTSWGDNGAGEKNLGRRFIASRSGYVSNVKVNLTAHSTTFNGTATLYSDDGTSPSSIIGTASSSTSMNSTGEKSMVFSTTDALIEKGKSYWIVISDIDGGSGNVTVQQTAGQIQGSGKSDTIASIIDNETNEHRMEITIDTSAGEPTPGHETLFLLQEEKADASTTFTEEGPLGLAITKANNVQYDTAQALGYGTSSILFDGTNDLLSLADSSIWSDMVDGDFTIEMKIRWATLGAKQGVIGHHTSNSWSGINWYIQVDSADVLQLAVGNNGGVGAFVDTASPVVIDTDYDICAMKIGGTIYIGIDGVWASATGSMSANNVAAVLRIGESAAAIADFNGWMKRIRISKCARFDPTGYTPQTIAYP